MNFGTIKYCDIADGEGVRTTLFVSGCTHRCKGCFQPETWDFSYGEEFSEEVADAIIESLKPAYIDGFTVLGGEPMEPSNQAQIAPLLERIRETCLGKTIWLYTGDIYEDLIDPESPRHTPFTERILDALDVLVDGPFVQDLKNISLRFRGSENQRLIDMPQTRAAGRVVLYEGDAAYNAHRM